MAFSENGTTNITSIHGFENIHYKIFGLSEAILIAENVIKGFVQERSHKLQENDFLASCDTISNDLWVFATSPDELKKAEKVLQTHDSGRSAFDDGDQEVFKTLTGGVVILSDLVSGLEKRFVKGADRQRLAFKSLRYSLFVSALTRRISRYLRLSGSFVPLGQCLYVKKRLRDPHRGSAHFDASFPIYRLQVDCIANNYLFISTQKACVSSQRSNSTDNVRCNDNASGPKALLAPGGHLVELLLSNTDKGIKGGFEPKGSFTRGQGLEGYAWRHRVSSELQNLGLSSPSFTSSDEWALVRLLHAKLSACDEPESLYEEVLEPLFEWPTELCITQSKAVHAQCRHPSPEGGEHSHVAGLEWFETSEHPPVLHPVEVIQQTKARSIPSWADPGSPHGGDTVRQPKTISPSHESLTRTPTGPLQHPPNEQSSAGMTYLSPSGSQVNNATPTSSSVDFAPGQTSSAPAKIPPRNAPSDLKSEYFGPQKETPDKVSSHVANNDSLEGEDVTEADFNFFDEPSSSQDREMRDAPPPQSKSNEQHERTSDIFAGEVKKHTGRLGKPQMLDRSKETPNTSLLGPNAVKRKLQHSTRTGGDGLHARSSNQFHPLDFSNLKISDNKYTNMGQFAARDASNLRRNFVEDFELGLEFLKPIPRVSRLWKPKSIGNRQPSERLHGNDSTAKKDQFFYHYSPEASLSDTDTGSHDESAGHQDDLYSFRKGTRPFRKRLKQSNGGTTTIEFSEEEEQEDELGETMSPDVLDPLIRFLLLSEPSSMILAERDMKVQPSLQPFSSFSFEHLGSEEAISFDESISVCQILTDQILSAQFEILASFRQAGPFEAVQRQQDLQVLEDTFCRALPRSTRLAVTDIFDLNVTPQGYPDIQNAVFYIEPPALRLQKASSDWDLSPVAVPFWESLGLAPTSGPKDIKACCIYPEGHFLDKSARDFLNQVTSAYHSHRLGSFEAFHDEDEELGFVPIRIGDNEGHESAMHSFREVCVFLGSEFASTTSDHNILVFMLNPFSNPASLAPLSTAFFLLKKSFNSSLVRNTLPELRHVALQIISIDQIASFTAPCILSFSQAASLGHKIYNKFPSSPRYDTGRLDLPIPSHSSVQLSHPAPPAIPFSVSSNVVKNLFKQDSVLHLAYAHGLAGQWVTAAWTDDVGSCQYTATYNAEGHQLEDILSDIWDTTIEIISARKVHWSVFVAKVGLEPEQYQLVTGMRKGISKQEKDVWKNLFDKRSEYDVTVSPALLIVDPHSDIAISPLTSPTGNSAPANNSDTSNPTPYSPARANGFSGGTDSWDASSRLVDMTDRTHGMLLASPRNVSPSISSYEPAISSGLLIRHGHADGGRDFEICGVDILLAPPLSESDLTPGDTGQQLRSHASSVLRKILIKYRGLAMLARYQFAGLPSFNDEGPEHIGTAPWHVAAAELGVRGLEKCLPNGCSSLVEQGQESSGHYHNQQANG